ncbi:MAG: hypothetical protein ACI93R_003769, partial [Flavobacteriales bacterium]
NVVKPGTPLLDIVGRVQWVEDVFVPKNNKLKSAKLPSRFRQEPRKVIVFKSGAIMKYGDVCDRYTLALALH